MRRSWPAHVIAVITIAVTLGVGALGALGSPKENVGAGRTSRGAASPAAEASAPGCRGRVTSGDLSFTCPEGWFVWQNTTFKDPSGGAQAIISNHRPLEQGGEGLPDAWFKVDMYVAARDPHLTFERLMRAPCTSTDGATLVSCRTVTIAGHRWIQRIERDPATQYRSIETVVDGIDVTLFAMVPNGTHAAEGRRAITALFSSLSIR